MTLTTILKAELLKNNLSAQAAEFIALTEACKLGQDKIINVYTDSQYTFSTVHVIAQQWKNSGMVTSTGKPIQHKDLILHLLDAVLLPTRVATCKCAAHTKLTDDISRGNHKADEAAKAAATAPHILLSLPPDTVDNSHSYVNTDLLKDMQSSSPEHEKQLWLSNNTTLQNGIYTCPQGKPILSKSLFRWAAIVSHGSCHVSTGRMVEIIKTAFAAYGFTNYTKHYCLSCPIWAKHNEQGHLRQREGDSHTPNSCSNIYAWISLN